jgi:hypothetical protein
LQKKSFKDEPEHNLHPGIDSAVPSTDMGVYVTSGQIAALEEATLKSLLFLRLAQASVCAVLLTFRFSQHHGRIAL